MGKINIETENVLSIMPWNICNAKCKHCGVNSSPKAKVSLLPSEVHGLINSAASLYEKDWTLSLTGGEIFYYYDKLLDLVNQAKCLNGYTSLVTNCFWGGNKKVVFKKLTELKQIGLRYLGISSDYYHEEYISIENVKNVVSVACELGINCEIRSVASKQSRLYTQVEKLKDINPWFVRFIELPLVPEGRALQIEKDNFLYSKEIPKGKCPAPTLTINFNGDAMVCCNGGGMFKYLQVGCIRDYCYETILYRYKSYPIINYLINNGPYGCLKLLDTKNRKRFLSDRYVNECDLCMKLFSDKYISDVIYKRINDLFYKGLDNISIDEFC